MFADNEMISERQLTVQLMLSFLGRLASGDPRAERIRGKRRNLRDSAGIWGICHLPFFPAPAGWRLPETGKGSRTGDEGGYSVSLRRDSDSVGGFSFSVHGADRGGISGGGRR